MYLIAWIQATLFSLSVSV